MIIKKYLKIVILVYCSLLFACTNSKEESISNFSADNNTYSTRGFVIEQPQQITIHVPTHESELNHLQLFSGALEVHNSVREERGLTPLKWSEKLVDYSQEWADQLGSGENCKMEHRPGTPTYGENLYNSGPKIWNDNGKEIYRSRDKVTIRGVVKKWAEEAQWYDHNANKCQEGKDCGHYTQLVSQNTTEVGCAVAFCPDKSQSWVCSYNPTG